MVLLYFNTDLKVLPVLDPGDGGRRVGVHNAVQGERGALHQAGVGAGAA